LKDLNTTIKLFIVYLKRILINSENNLNSSIEFKIDFGGKKEIKTRLLSY